ncbi:hypothetical protein [uncultured Bradyrhizobium sp.]|uniref:hypothetical protein n=1 Tax=Bradyrhizobium sp. TaxID=376 RepID=UPI00262BBAA5|nr:hypothetical protein [uncultured Bradyrhizobium sp.]
MQLNLPRHIVEKSWAKKLERLVSAWTATRPPVARNRTEFGVSVKRRTQRNLLSEDLDMRHLSAWFREITRTYDRLLEWLERRSVVLSSRGRRGIAGRHSAKAYVRKRARRLHRRVSSLASKVAAKTTATTSR